MNDACSKPSDICVITNTIKYIQKVLYWLLIDQFKICFKMSMSVTGKKFYKEQVVSNEIDAILKNVLNNLFREDVHHTNLRFQNIIGYLKESA